MISPSSTGSHRSRILLVNPLLRRKGSVFPAGIAYVAASLEHAGYAVDMLDQGRYEWSDREMHDFLRNHQYDIVMTGALLTGYLPMKLTVETLRRYHPDTTIVLGGPGVTSIPDAMFRFLDFDAAILGEAEYSAVELVDACFAGRTLRGIEGVWYRDPDSGEVVKNPERANIRDLDELPFPAWHLFDIDHYKGHDPYLVKIPTLSVVGQRGCPYKCTFCYQNFGRVSRPRSPENLVAEMEELHARHGIRGFTVGTDLFLAHPKIVRRFCELLIERGHEFVWQTTGRVNVVTPELLALMRRAGCEILAYGFESGSQRQLDRMLKECTVETAGQAARMTEAAGIRVSGSFMAFEGETLETLQETWDFIEKYDLYQRGIFIVNPYPKTPIYKEDIWKDWYQSEEDFYIALGDAVQMPVNLTEIEDHVLPRLIERMSLRLALNYWERHDWKSWEERKPSPTGLNVAPPDHLRDNVRRRAKEIRGFGDSVDEIFRAILDEDAALEARLSAIMAPMAAQGCGRVGIYGFTALSLAPVWVLRKLGCEVPAFFDRNPDKQRLHYRTVPVYLPERLAETAMDALLICSRAHADEIERFAKAVLPANVAIVRAFEAAPMVELTPASIC